MSINAENVEKWVAALRGGEYLQGKSTLRNGDKYCCLGVACDLYRKATWRGEWTPVNDSCWNFKLDGDLSSGIMPKAVAAWLGLGSRDPTLGDSCATEMNDGGKSFAQIADAIEQEFLK